MIFLAQSSACCVRFSTEALREKCRVNAKADRQSHSEKSQEFIQISSNLVVILERRESRLAGNETRLVTNFERYCILLKEIIIELLLFRYLE